MRSFRQLSNDVTTGVLALAALLVVVLAIRAQFSPSREPTYVLPAPLPSELDSGQIIGARTASVRITEFADFQCEYCAQLQPALRRLVHEHRPDVAIVFKHFPLEMTHPHAFNAALASECAGEQGEFESFHDHLFAHQESIGKDSWQSFARDAGLPDLGRFEQCMSEKRYASRILDDKRAGRTVGIKGTPSLIINGEVLYGAVAWEGLEKRVKRALANEPPK